MRWFAKIVFCIGIAIFSSGLIAEVTNKNTTPSYTTPQAFMDLYSSFTGGSSTAIGTILGKTISAAQKGALVLVLNSSVYVYGPDRKLMGTTNLRTVPNSGFY